ncbi:hypothetical protein HELRODRAFT_178767 [Helobdella robusta]|uniref:C-type lectin domain-containing protein n=1 Tax=Helobdella robusta TaxID=6412 RepID=T1FDP6_HELRO|nr:hypothetical protein HELRODRAFT_178767 [Helobdella robusta]ESN96963.1 hypothetical protein HELRODRAFT_178767 [Helobdella robusta]
MLAHISHQQSSYIFGILVHTSYILNIISCKAISHEKKLNGYVLEVDSHNNDLCVSRPAANDEFQNVVSLLKCASMCSRRLPYSCVRFNYKKSESLCELYNHQRDDYTLVASSSRDQCVSYLNTACLPPFSLTTPNSFCYHLLVGAWNFQEAGAACRDLNAASHAVAVDDFVENNALKNYMLSVTTTSCRHPVVTSSIYIWTAGRRHANSSSSSTTTTTFAWQLSATNFQTFGPEQSWMGGEPNFDGSCVLLVFSLLWNDDDCSKQLCVVCEIDVLY